MEEDKRMADLMTVTSPNIYLGLSTWAQNFLHVGYGSYNARNLASITCPYQEYMIFCFFKSAQIASIIGIAGARGVVEKNKINSSKGMFVRPIYTWHMQKELKPEEITTNTPKIIRATCRRIQGRILLGGLFASPLLMAASIYVNDYTPEKLAMRCYQIRCDENLLAYDRSTAFLGWLGWYWKRFQGAVDGINLALVYTVFHVKIEKKFLNPVNVNFADKEGLDKFATIEDSELDSGALYQFIKKKLKESGIIYSKEDPKPDQS